MSKAVRMSIIVALGLVLFGVPVALQQVGARQATDEVVRIRAAGATAHVDMSRLLAPVYDAGAHDPVAASLGVDRTSVSTQQDSSGWCTHISVRRLIAQRDVSFLVAQDGGLRPVDRCPGRGG